MNEIVSASTWLQTGVLMTGAGSSPGSAFSHTLGGRKSLQVKQNPGWMALNSAMTASTASQHHRDQSENPSMPYMNIQSRK